MKKTIMITNYIFMFITFCEFLATFITGIVLLVITNNESQIDSVLKLYNPLILLCFIFDFITIGQFIFTLWFRVKIKYSNCVEDIKTGAIIAIIIGLMPLGLICIFTDDKKYFKKQDYIKNFMEYPYRPLIEEIEKKKEEALKQLHNLKELYDQGLISKEEYQDMSRKYLDQLR